MTAIDHVLAFLIPIFLAGANGDQAAARQAAIELLQAHSTANGRDLLLSGEIVAFSFATLDSLGKSMADPQMAITTRLRLRSNANALSRATERNRKALERPGKPLTPPAVSTPLPASLPAPLPTAMQRVRDAIVQAAPSLAETLTQAGTQPMSRQQRRFLERKAEKARAAKEREISRTARLAEWATAKETSGMSKQETSHLEMAQSS